MCPSSSEHTEFELFTKLITNMPMIYYALDEEWHFTLSEGQGLFKLGLQPGQVVGASAKEMYKDYPDIIEAIERAFQGEKVHIEHVLGQLHLENYIIPIYNHLGEINGIIGATIDVTERKEAEVELMKSRKFQQAIIDSVPGMLYMYNAAGELVYWNKAHEVMTGYNNEELDHFHLFDWYKDDPVSQQSVTTGLEATVKNSFGEAEAELQCKNGHKLPCYFTAAPLKVDDEDYFVGIGLDITRRKAAEDALKKMNLTLEEQVEERTKQLKDTNEELVALNEEMTAINEALHDNNEKMSQMQAYLVESEKMAALGGLVAGVAHEVNTPVGIGITASTYLMETLDELLHKQLEGSINQDEMISYVEDIKKAAEMIYKNLDRAGKLIQSFKQLSVDQSSEPKRQFDVKKYLDEILLTLSPSFKNTNIDIIVDCEEGLMMNGLPGAFAQIITNLAMNSLNHGFEPGTNGRIDIKLSSNEQMVKLVYKDNGIGMTEKTLSKMFDPFYTTKRNSGGTGLGMTVVYSIVNQQFNGYISCQSEEGIGTRFTIELDKGDIA